MVISETRGPVVNSLGFLRGLFSHVGHFESRLFLNYHV